MGVVFFKRNRGIVFVANSIFCLDLHVTIFYMYKPIYSERNFLQNFCKIGVNSDLKIFCLDSVESRLVTIHDFLNFIWRSHVRFKCESCIVNTFHFFFWSKWFMFKVAFTVIWQTPDSSPMRSILVNWYRFISYH